MPRSPSRLAVAGLAAFAVVVGSAALPAEAKVPAFKKVFIAKLPGEPKPARTFKAATKGIYAAATGYSYFDATGALTLNGVAGNIPGLTTINITMNANVFAGMDLTDVTFPVTRAALVVLSYTKTTIKLKDPTHPKIKAYNYSSDSVGGCTVTVTSYDPVKNEMTGTIDGNVVFHENLQDPSDDARDGKVITVKGAKFALKPVGQ